jgi:hypothetical protein
MHMSERESSTPEQIEQRAYQLYLDRGGEDGNDLADWFAAERELTAFPEQSSFGAPTPRANAAGLQANSPTAGKIAQEVR